VLGARFQQLYAALHYGCNWKLRVHRVKFQFNLTTKKEKGEEKRTTETECALASKEQKDCRLGRNAVGVLLASREVQGRMDHARR